MQLVFDFALEGLVEDTMREIGIPCSDLSKGLLAEIYNNHLRTTEPNKCKSLKCFLIEIFKEII